MNGWINSNVFSNLYTILRLHSTHRAKEGERLRINKRWTIEEDLILEENYGYMSHIKLLDLLPGRGYEAVRKRGRTRFNRILPLIKRYVRRCPDCDSILVFQRGGNSWVCPTDYCHVIRVNYKYQRNKVNPQIDNIIYEAIPLNSC